MEILKEIMAFAVGMVILWTCCTIAAYGMTLKKESATINGTKMLAIAIAASALAYIMQ